MDEQAQILGNNGKPMPSTQQMGDRLEAERYYQMARATLDAEQSVKKFIDIMRKAGKDFEDISKHGEQLHEMEMKILSMRKGQVSAWKAMAPEMNMSIEQIRKMPIKDLVGNIGALGGSLGKLLTPVLSLGTIATASAAAVQFVVDAMGHLNTAARGFSVQSGALFQAGGFSPTHSMKEMLGLGEFSLSKLGMTSAEDRMKMLQAVSGSVPKITPASGAGAAVAAVRIGASTGVGPEKGLEMLSEAARFNVPMAQFQQGLRDAANDIKELPTKQAAESMLELWRSSRNLGMGWRESEAVVKSFQTELRSGILTIQDLQKMSVGARQAPFTDVARFLVMAKASGVKGLPEKGTLFEQGGRFIESNQASGGREVERVYKQIVETFAKRFGGGAGGRSMAVQAVGSFPFVPQNLVNEVYGQGTSAGAGRRAMKAPSETDFTAVLADLSPNLEKMDDQTRGLWDSFGKLADKAKILTEQFGNLGDKLPSKATPAEKANFGFHENPYHKD